MAGYDLLVRRLDRLEYRLRVGGLGERFSLGIMTIVDATIIAPKLFQQFNDLGCLLLAQDREFERQLLAVRGQLVLAPLRRQDQHRHVKRSKAD